MKVNRVKPLVTARKRARTALPEDSAPADRTEAAVTPSETTGSHWTFLTNHLHVLILLSRNPSVVLRNVALQVKITERAVQRIIADLESGGYIEREPAKPLSNPTRSATSTCDRIASQHRRLVDVGQRR
jgi:hypothetical protein